MMELNVTLEFACCCCEECVKVTVQCSGPGLQESDVPVATVNIPCPTCGRINKLIFEPSGHVRSVRPYMYFGVVPEPSVN